MRQRIMVVNLSGETAPKGGCALTDDLDATTDLVKLKKPDADNDPTACLIVDDIANGALGEIIGFGFGRFQHVNGQSPAWGDNIGSTSGSWYWNVDDAGTVLVDAVEGSGDMVRGRFRHPAISDDVTSPAGASALGKVAYIRTHHFIGMAENGDYVHGESSDGFQASVPSMSCNLLRISVECLGQGPQTASTGEITLTVTNITTAETATITLTNPETRKEEDVALAFAPGQEYKIEVSTNETDLNCAADLVVQLTFGGPSIPFRAEIQSSASAGTDQWSYQCKFASLGAGAGYGRWEESGSAFTVYNVQEENLSARYPSFDEWDPVPTGSIVTVWAELDADGDVEYWMSEMPVPGCYKGQPPES